MIIHVDCPEEKYHVETSGGEQWVDDTKIDSYCITINDASIDDLPAEVLKELIIKAANHLIVNGHRFKIVKGSEQDQPYELVDVT